MYYCFFQEYVRNVKESQPKRSCKDMKWWEKLVFFLLAASTAVLIAGVIFNGYLYGPVWSNAMLIADAVAVGTSIFLYWYTNHFNYRLAREKNMKFYEHRVSTLKDTLQNSLFQYYDQPHIEWLYEKTVFELTIQENVKKQCQKVCATVLGVVDVFKIYYIHNQLDNLAHINVSVFLYNVIALTVSSIAIYYGVTELVNMVQIKKASLYALKDDLEYLRAEMLSETKKGR